MMANQRVDDESSLPKEYLQLEYLESTGTQYIDTEEYFNENFGIEVDFQSNKKVGGTFQSIFGAQSSSVAYRLSYIIIGNNTAVRLVVSNSNLLDTDMLFDNVNDANERHRYGINAYYLKAYLDNKEMLMQKKGLLITQNSVYVLARNNTNTATNFATGKLYRVKCWLKESVIHNLIPALRIADLKPGMYDLVTGQFFVNQGTGEFVFEMPDIPDTIKPYLCFEAVENDFQAEYSINPCEYSIDDRKTWNELPADTLTPPINAGKKIYFRGRGAKSASIPYSRGTFSTTKLFNISGNMLSMIHGSDFLTGKNDQYSYSWMFRNNKNIVSISENLLNVPVSFRDFYGIFENSSIRNVDIHRFNNGVYYYAFKNSTLEKVNITSSSSLPTQCFTESFSGTQIQELDIPCKSIQYAGLLTAATSCKYLTKVIIRATSITYNESNTNYFNYFKSSFQNCSALNSVIFLVANIPLSKRISDNWLTGVAEEGTIILNKNITWNPEDYRNGNIDNVEGSVTLGETITWGIPANWEVKYCDPDNIDDVRDYREIDQPW